MAQRLILSLAVAFLALATVVGPRGAALAEPATGLHRDVVFTDYSPLSGNAELTRRMVTPLTGVEVARLATQGKALRDQPIDLSKERFTLYVPAQAPPGGYALMVFVSPEEPAFPAGWAGVLDRRGIIFVSAQRSGNDQSVLGRREPLALLAAINVMKRYPVNPNRVFVAGFSGGSRVAMHLALGYPDLFRGAFLNAGSDPIGDLQAPIPPADLFARFQEHSRLVYVSGALDPVHLSWDANGIHSMKSWCVFDLDSTTTPGAAHELAASSVLNHALQELEAPTTPNPQKLAACRASVAKAMAAELDAIAALVAAGKNAEAKTRLLKADARFGGLAATRSLGLWDKVGR